MNKYIYTFMLVLLKLIAQAQSDPAPLNPIPSTLLGYRQIVGLDTQHYAYQKDGWILFAGKNWINKSFLHLSDSAKYVTPYYLSHSDIKFKGTPIFNNGFVANGISTLNGSIISNGSSGIPLLISGGTFASHEDTIALSTSLYFHTLGSFDFIQNGKQLFRIHGPTDGTKIERLSDGASALFTGDAIIPTDTIVFKRKADSIGNSGYVTRYYLTHSSINLSNITLPSNSFIANNTGSTASPTASVFKDVPQQTYSGTPFFTGTTAPTGLSNNTYQWTQIGHHVTMRFNFLYATVGSAITLMQFTLPADMPAPVIPTGLNSANAELYFGNGGSANDQFSTSQNSNCTLSNNSTNTGFIISITTASSNPSYFFGTISYWAQ